MIDDLLERGSNKIFADFNDHLRLDFPLTLVHTRLWRNHISLVKFHISLK
jgi:hypothetical protein